MNKVLYYLLTCQQLFMYHLFLFDHNEYFHVFQIYVLSF